MDKQKIFDWVLKSFLFLSPLFYFRTYQLSFARGLFFVLGTFVLFGISLLCEPRRRFSNLWLSAFLLLALIRVFFSDYIGSHNSEWFNFWLNCAGFIYVFCGCLLFYIVYCYANEPKEYLKPILLVCILNFTLVRSQLLKVDFMWHNAPTICGFFETSSQLGQYSALALPIVFFIHPFLVIFPLFTLIISKSISSMLACALGMAFLGGFKGRILKIKIGVGVILVLLASLNFGMIKAKFQCRPPIWRETLRIALQKPYLGGGYQSFQDKVTKIAGSILGGLEFSRAHNDYLHTAQELGFPILICAGIFFFNLFKKFRIAVKDRLTWGLGISILIGLINMSGQTMIRYSSVSSTFIILLALLYVYLNDRKEKHYAA